jgi:hypothetical protein
MRVPGSPLDHHMIKTALGVGLPGRSDHGVSHSAPEPSESGPIRGLTRWFDHHVINQRLSALEASVDEGAPRGQGRLALGHSLAPFTYCM